MKLSVTSYSYHKLIKSGLHTQYSIISLSKSIGFDGIEFTDLTPPEGTDEMTYAALLKEEAARVGLPIVCYAAKANLCEENAVESLCHKVDICEALGCGLMRHDVVFVLPEGKTFDELVPMFAEKIRAVTEYAKKKGIRTCTENHGKISQAPERVKKIIDTVANDNFGWLCDMGNFLCADCEPLPSVKTALPYIVHAHAKDFIYDESGFETLGGKHLVGVRIGTGVVPVPECVRAIRESGYDGYLTVEYEGSTPNVPALRESIDYLLPLIGD